MSQIPDQILYDVRLLERHLRKGLLSREQVDKRLAQLADTASGAEALDVESYLPADRTPTDE